MEDELPALFQLGIPCEKRPLIEVINSTTIRETIVIFLYPNIKHFNKGESKSRM